MPQIRAATVVLAILFILCLAGPVRAQTADPFTVANVQVDVRAENVNLARDRALLDGQREAYQTLMQRLTAATDWNRLPKVTDSELEDRVLDVGIDQEKRSTVR